MRLQDTYKWATYQMTLFDWVCMASTYNTAIMDMNVAQSLTFPLKMPCALLDKLSKVETEIFGCL